MMKIKVYHNEDGTVKITKITGNGEELPMFSDISIGEAAEIEIEIANLSVSGRRC